MSFAEALAHRNPIVTVYLPCGATERLRNAVAKLFLALVAAGDAGICQADCANLTGHLPSHIGLLRPLLGGKEAIGTHRGDVRRAAATKYRLAVSFPFTLEGGE
ncbi:MAG: hypothetical protein B7Y35_02930 [Sphingomonadales bacterium 28-64-96]|nr:MAG: hypothetical protein B7Y35_02930 [Sphingomonadales bacterium 28-64-96]